MAGTTQPLQLPDPTALIASLGPVAPLQDGQIAGVTAPTQEPISVQVSSDDTMDLSRELADIMDRHVFEEACQRREMRFEEQLQVAHEEACSGRVTVAKIS